MNMERAQATLEVRRLMDSLADSAKIERLESALPLIDALRRAYALEAGGLGLPVGVLTVQSWLELLNQWENALDDMPRRRVQFLQEFFQDAVASNRLEQTSIGPILQELLVLMDEFVMRQSAQAA